MFSAGLIPGGRECLCATSQKCFLTRVILFTVNYCLFANGDVSIRFNGKDDNVVLEFILFIFLLFFILFYLFIYLFFWFCFVSNEMSKY